MIQNLNTKYHSLNPTQIQIRLIKDLQDFRIRMMSLRNDQKKSFNLISNPPHKKPESKLDTRTKPTTKLSGKQQDKLNRLFAEMEGQEAKTFPLYYSDDEDDVSDLGYTEEEWFCLWFSALSPQ